MSKIKITVDSTCDLSPELLEKYQISVSPLYIVKDGKSLKDGVLHRRIFTIMWIRPEMLQRLLRSRLLIILNFLSRLWKKDMKLFISISAPDFPAVTKMPALQQKSSAMFIRWIL